MTTEQVRRYWNERIHDLEMTTQPVGSREFFADLDDYRFDKLRYLPQLVDFASGYKTHPHVDMDATAARVLVELHRLANGGDRVRSFPDHCHHRCRRNIRDKSFIKRFAFVDGVMRFGQLIADLHKSRGDQTESSALQAGNDLPHQRALHTVGFD